MNKESKWEEYISGNNQQFLPPCASLITEIADVHLSFLKKMHSHFCPRKTTAKFQPVPAPISKSRVSEG